MDAADPATILVVEDDPALNAALAATLKAAGFRPITAKTAAEGLRWFAHYAPDLVLLDLGLPDRDGLTVIGEIRQRGPTPIVVLSARDAEAVKVEALDLGADDYVAKPFSLGELLARVRAIMRRSDRQPAGSREVLDAGALRVDTGSRRAWSEGAELTLSQKEFDLLTCLIRNRGMALSRDVLLERVWGYDFLGDSRTVDVHIRWLREKVEPDPSRPIYIQTVRGVGYRFEIPVK